MTYILVPFLRKQIVNYSFDCYIQSFEQWVWSYEVRIVHIHHVWTCVCDTHEFSCVEQRIILLCFVKWFSFVFSLSLLLLSLLYTIKSRSLKLLIYRLYRFLFISIGYLLLTWKKNAIIRLLITCLLFCLCCLYPILTESVTCFVDEKCGKMENFHMDD